MKVQLRVYLTTILLFIEILAVGQSNDRKEFEISLFLDSLNQDEFSEIILVSHNNRLIEKKAYGLSNIGFSIKNNLETKFNIASIVIMITAIATLQLYEPEKIKLGVPIGEYLPDYP